MSVTLREYLDQYQKRRNKTLPNQKCGTGQLLSLTCAEYDCQKIFQQKINNLKKTLRSCIDDLHLYLKIQKQIEQLKTIFYKNRNMSICKSKTSFDQSAAIQKSTRSKYNQNKKTNANTDGLTGDKFSIPVIEINDNVFDDLTGTNIPDKNRSQVKIYLSSNSHQSENENNNQNVGNADTNRKQKERIKTQPNFLYQIYPQNKNNNLNFLRHQSKKQINNKISQNTIQYQKQQQKQPQQYLKKTLKRLQLQKQSYQIHKINLISPNTKEQKQKQEHNVPSFAYKDKKYKVDMSQISQSKTINSLQQPQRIQSDKLTKKQSILPPALDKKQSKYSQDQIQSVRHTNISKCSYAESKIFYFNK